MVLIASTGSGDHWICSHRLHQRDQHVEAIAAGVLRFAPHQAFDRFEDLAVITLVLAIAWRLRCVNQRLPSLPSDIPPSSFHAPFRPAICLRPTCHAVCWCGDQAACGLGFLSNMHPA